jgi:hypothetical protein
MSVAQPVKAKENTDRFVLKTSIFAVVTLSGIFVFDYYMSKTIEANKKLQETHCIPELIYKEDDDAQTKIDIRLIYLDIKNFRDIKNKTEQICLYVVKRKPKYIRHITNPSNEVCIEALKCNIYVIKYIENPSDEIMRYVVNRNGLLIQHIKKPSHEICFAAIEQNPNAIRLIKKEFVTKEMQLKALELGVTKIGYYLPHFFPCDCELLEVDCGCRINNNDDDDY